MRAMEWIRRKGATCLGIFLVVFLISVFAGIGVGVFTFKGCSGSDGSQGAVSRRPKLVPDGELAKAAMRINGRIVPESQFNELLNDIFDRMRGAGDDPGLLLEVYGQTALLLLREEIVLAKGEELGITVTGADINEARDRAIASYLTEQEGASGNVLGDLAQRLSSSRQRKAAFAEYLQRNGLTEEFWEKRIRRELLVQKTRDSLQEAADAVTAVEAAETKAIIDQRLEEGESFADLARQYSDDANAEKGGDLETWLSYSLFQDIPDRAEQLFATAIGDRTDWFEIPAGWQCFEIYDKKEAAGEEFEAARASLIQGIRTDKGEDYEPSEEEIVQAYEQVKARQILLRAENPGAGEDQISEMVEVALVEINDPYVLTYQALNAFLLQPPLSVTFDNLVAIAQNSHLGEDYDFSLIQQKLEKGQPTRAHQEPADDAADQESAEDEEAQPDVSETPPATDETGEQPADGEAEPDEESISVEWPADETEEEPEIIPIYALAIGLMKAAIQDEPDTVHYFPYYIIAKTYMDWLESEGEMQGQPLDRAAAREEAEENFARVLERNEYSSTAHAYRGLNLAWLDRPEEAELHLKKAADFAPPEMGGVWDIIREAYEVLEDDAALAALDEREAEIRQEQLRRQIEQQQQQAAEAAAMTPAEPTEEEPSPAGDAGAPEEGALPETEDAPPPVDEEPSDSPDTPAEDGAEGGGST